ncbi:hypothetical protein PENTCL1PPCAC_26343, partial [Pristionchus entomophagus]
VIHTIIYQFWDPISISSLIRCIILISIQWSSMKDGMIKHYRCYTYAQTLIIMSEISLILICAHSIQSIVNAFQNRQVVNRSFIFLLTISSLEMVFNILLFKILENVKIRWMYKHNSQSINEDPVKHGKWIGRSGIKVKFSTANQREVEDAKIGKYTKQSKIILEVKLSQVNRSVGRLTVRYPSHVLHAAKAKYHRHFVKSVYTSQSKKIDRKERDYSKSKLGAYSSVNEDSMA